MLNEEQKVEPASENGNTTKPPVSGSTDMFGTIMTCLPKYSNCQLCKYKNEPQDSDVCTYCAKHNKSTEYYR